MLIFIAFLLLLTSIFSQETITLEANTNTRLPGIPEHLEYGRLDKYLVNNTLPTFARSGLASEYVLFALDNYGCWCRSDTYTEGKGTPVDVFDAICKNKFKSYDCIDHHDFDGCDARNEPYFFNIWKEDNTLYVQCDSTKNSECQSAICKTDIQTMYEYFPLVNEFIFPQGRFYNHQSIGGPFDPSSSCTVAGTRKREDRTKTCCGDYPYRGWFVGSENECCEFQRTNKKEQELWNDFSMRIGKYYDRDSQICCDNGVKGIFELC